MDGLIMAGQLLLALSILIILHELGHFWAARAFGIKVEKFYLFFDAWGVKLFSFNYKGCEYGIGWLPLGGYVKIAGMIDESMDTEQLALPPQPWEFRSKPAWQRLIVMLGGITVNLLLGILIFWVLVFKNGETFIANDKLEHGVAPGKVGREIGIEPGDKILAINGKPVQRFDEILGSKVLLGSDLTIDRKGETKIINVPSSVLELISDYGPGEFLTPRMPLQKIKEVSPGSNAAKAGLKAGDSVLAINNKPIQFVDEFQSVVQDNKNKAITLAIMRGGQALTMKPQVNGEGTIGVALATLKYPTETVKHSFISSLPIGASKAWGSFMANAKGIGKVVTGQVKANKAFTSPIGIAQMFGATVDWTWFWSLVGILSMALALMNLLPIPALDGGHAVFLVVEMIKGKPLGDKFMEKAQIVGFVILVALMVFTLGNDILKIIVN